MTDQSTEIEPSVYLDYDAALTQVREAASRHGAPTWLVNATALLLASADYDPERGYQLDRHLLDHPDHVRRFTGVDLVAQAKLGAQMIAADDPTSGRRSHITAIAAPNEGKVIVTFSTGDQVIAEPTRDRPAIMWTDSRRPNEHGHLSWVGHDRFALKLREIARSLRRQEVFFNARSWVDSGYQRIHGGTTRPGPTPPPRRHVTSPEMLSAPIPPQYGPDQMVLFTNRLFAVVSAQATEWAAADGVELTVVDSGAGGPHPPSTTAGNAALTAVLARIEITLTGPAHRDDGWTINYPH